VKYKLTIPIWAIGLTITGTAQADDSTTAVSGVMYSHFSVDMTDGADNATNFGLDRAYLTAKRSVTDTLSTRLTLDVGRAKSQSIELSDADGEVFEVSIPEDTKLRFFMKYAYLQWDTPMDGVTMRFGAAGTPWVGFADKFWGHRYVSKAFTDRNKILSSSDLGLHFVGAHNDGMLSWQANFINGEGYGSPEDGPDKTTQVRVTADLLAGNDSSSLPISAFASTELLNADDDDPTTVVIGSVGYKMSSLAVWGEYVMEMEGDVTGSGYSGVVRPSVGDIGSVIVRYDHWDPDTDTADDASTTIIAGVSKDFAKKISTALTYERQTEEVAIDTPSHGVFIRTQTGF